MNMAILKFATFGLPYSMYANLVQVCTAINREFIFPGAKNKKKRNGRLEFNAYSVTLCFRRRRRRQIRLTLLLT